MINVLDNDENRLSNILNSFYCDKDEDIQLFFREKSVNFERLSKARTYLVCDENQMLEEDFSIDNLKIYGYIALALKVLTVPEDTSNRVRKELDGLSAKIHGERLSDFPCYLIGQLSKNSNLGDNNITGAELLQLACDVIAASVEAVGGRYIMIECKDNIKLTDFYSKNGFKEIARIPDSDEPMVQMVRKFYV